MMRRTSTWPRVPDAPWEIVAQQLAIRLASRFSLLTVFFLAGCCGKQESKSAGWVAAAKASPARMIGVLDATDCQTIRGWAWDPKRPDDPIKVDIYDGDQLIKTLLADQYRDDLEDMGFGNGKHMFEMVPPSRLSDGEVHQISAKFSGRTYDLNLSPRSFICAEEETGSSTSVDRSQTEK